MAATTMLEKREGAVAQPERTRGGPFYVPAVDILETKDELLLLADVPGATAESVDLNFDNGQLTIHAHVEPRQPAETTNYLLREYGVGDFYRSFQIGELIDANRIQAEIHDGVLTLHLPKVESAKPRKIAVTSK